MSDGYRALAIRFIKAYLSLVAMILFVLIVSLSKGVGWKVILVGMPLYVTVFWGITYSLIKEWRAMRKKSRRRNDIFLFFLMRARHGYSGWLSCI